VFFFLPFDFLFFQSKQRVLRISKIFLIFPTPYATFLMFPTFFSPDGSPQGAIMLLNSEGSTLFSVLFWLFPFPPAEQPFRFVCQSIFSHRLSFRSSVFLYKVIRSLRFSFLLYVISGPQLGMSPYYSGLGCLRLSSPSPSHPSAVVNFRP